MGNPLRRFSYKLAGKLGQGRFFLGPDKGEPIILMYHGVNGGRDSTGDHKHVNEARFREHLEFMGRYRRVVPLTQMVKALLAGEKCAGQVAITFDDGYLNNAEAAAPILKEYGMPGTFFLATGFIGVRRWAWTDRVEHVSYTAPAQTAQLKLGPGEGTPTTVTIGSDEDRAKLIQSIKARLKTLHWRDAETEIGQIGDTLKVPRDAPAGQYRFMNWDDARRMARDGFEMGAHTVNHAILSRVPLDVAREEILTSQTTVANELGACCSTFCYPNGKKTDFNAEVMDICRGSFDAALSAISGAARAGDRFEIRRIGIDQKTTAQVLAGRMLNGA